MVGIWAPFPYLWCGFGGCSHMVRAPRRGIGLRGQWWANGGPLGPMDSPKMVSVTHFSANLSLGDRGGGGGEAFSRLTLPRVFFTSALAPTVCTQT